MCKKPIIIIITAWKFDIMNVVSTWMSIAGGNIKNKVSHFHVQNTSRAQQEHRRYRRTEHLSLCLKNIKTGFQFHGIPLCMQGSDVTLPSRTPWHVCAASVEWTMRFVQQNSTPPHRWTLDLNLPLDYVEKSVTCKQQNYTVCIIFTAICFNLSAFSFHH